MDLCFVEVCLRAVLFGAANATLSLRSDKNMRSLQGSGVSIARCFKFTLIAFS